MNEAAPPAGKNMGKPYPRIDARLKVTGEARYPADIPVHDPAYGVLAITTVARGEIVRIDTDRARAVPGVIDIFAHDAIRGDLDPPKFGPSSTSVAPLNQTRVWHNGQIMALVVAETEEAAEEAAALIRANYKSEQPSATFGSPGTKTVPATESDSFKENPKAGDFERAYAAADVKIDERYSTPTQHHNPMELFSTTAVWSNGEVTIMDPSQNVNGWRAEFARQLKIGGEKVRVLSPYVGGAFGSKGPANPRTAIVALAARRLGRPVRCVVSRTQAYTTQTYRAETEHRIRMGANRDGKITAFSHEGLEVTSRPDLYVVGGTETTARLYDYGTVATDVKLVQADRNTPSYMRSPPETPYVYALENAMDEMAVAIGMDPVEFRRVNDTTVEPIGGKRFSSRHLMECYDQAAASFGWSKRGHEPGSMRDGDWLIGMGCASAVYPTHIAPCTARVRLSADGHVRVQTAANEIGTGIRTVAAQMASEQLGIAMDRIEVEVGDSRLPPAPVAGGSNTTASVCSTIVQACQTIRRRLFEAAVSQEKSPLEGHDPATLDIRDGHIVTGNDSMPVVAALKELGVGAIEEYAEFAPQGISDAIPNLYGGKMQMAGGPGGEMVKYAFGAEFVEVRINAYTREIRVPRVTGAFAAGRIMNTRTAHSQLMSGMIWGISQALLEATEMDRRAAQYLNRDLQDYLVPVNADIKEVDVILVPEVDDDVNPAGVKGIGELGNVGTAAAVASAVYHATGRRIRDLPIRVEDLLP